MLVGLGKQRLPAVFFMLFTAVLLCASSKFISENNGLSCAHDDTVKKSEAKLSLYDSRCKIAEKYQRYLMHNNPMHGIFNGVCSCCGLPVGCNGSSGVYLCDDGYLINKPVDYKDRFLKNIEIIKEFAALTDAKISVMLAPQAGYVLEDKLPALHADYDDEKLISEAEKEFDGTGINFIRLDGKLKSRAEDTKIYYKTDHHWTSAGAYMAYCAFCSANGLEATPKSEYNVTKYGGFYGSVYGHNPVYGAYPDVIEIWQSKKSADSITVEIEQDGKLEESLSPFFMSHIDEADKYQIFLDGNHGLARIKNTASKGGKLLIIRDSFAQALAPFLADNYSEIILVDMRYYKSSAVKLLKKGDVNEVLFMYSIGVLAMDTDIVWCIT